MLEDWKISYLNVGFEPVTSSWCWLIYNFILKDNDLKFNLNLIKKNSSENLSKN